MALSEMWREMSYHKTKLDGNHTQIVDFLKSNGVWVWDCASVGGMTDLIVYYKETGFLEIKMAQKAQMTRAQLIFIALTPAPVGIVINEIEALEFAKDPRGKGLSQSQKNKIGALIWAHEPNKQKFEFRRIRELIG